MHRGLNNVQDNKNTMLKIGHFIKTKCPFVCNLFEFAKLNVGRFTYSNAKVIESMGSR